MDRKTLSETLSEFIETQRILLIASPKDELSRTRVVLSDLLRTTLSLKGVLFTEGLSPSQLRSTFRRAQGQLVNCLASELWDLAPRNSQGLQTPQSWCTLATTFIYDEQPHLELQELVPEISRSAEMVIYMAEFIKQALKLQA